MTIGPATGYRIPYNYPQLWHPSSRLTLNASPDEYPSFSSDEAETLSLGSAPDQRNTVFTMVPDGYQAVQPQEQLQLPDPNERYLTPLSQVEGSQAASFVSFENQDSSPFIRYALQHLAAPYSHTARPADRPMSVSTESSYPVERGVYQPIDGAHSSIGPDQPLDTVQPSLELAPAVVEALRMSPVESTRSPVRSPAQSMRHSPSVQSPLPTNSPGRTDSVQQTDSLDDISLEKELMYIPCDAPESSFRHRKLDYIPVMLKLPVLLSYAAIAFAAGGLLIWGGIKTNTAAYNSSSRGQRFIYRFLPQLLAALYMLALQPVEAALTRVSPFIAFTSENARIRSRAHFIPLWKSNYFFPRVSYIQDGLYLSALASIAFWLQLFTIPLLSALCQIGLVVSSDGYLTANWVVSQPVAFLTAGIYILLGLSLTALAIRFAITEIGLKWMPASIADLAVLIRRSNLARDFAGTELVQSRRVIRAALKMRSDRLGYWRTDDQSQDVLYALAEEGGAPRRFSVLRGKTMEKRANESNIWSFVAHARPRPESDITTGSGRNAVNIHSPFVRFAYIPWYLTDSAVIAWAVVGFFLWLALIVVSFVHSALQRGFDPLLEFDVSPTGSSSAGFFYAFLPSLLGMIIFLGWRTLDTTYRALQPWANLANKRGASAAETILLDYTLDAPGVVTIRALLRGHYKVAAVSALTVVTAIVAVLAGGLFQPVLDLIHHPGPIVRTDMAAFGVMLAFLTLVVLLLPTLFPTRRRYLPHAVQTTGEIISFLYASPLLDDRPFRDSQQRNDMTDRLETPLSGDGPLGGFAFGVFTGRDGKEHLGVDRIYRDMPSDGEGTV